MIPSIIIPKKPMRTTIVRKPLPDYWQWVFCQMSSTKHRGAALDLAIEAKGIQYVEVLVENGVISQMQELLALEEMKTGCDKRKLVSLK